MIQLLFSFLISMSFAGEMMSVKGELEKACSQTDCRIKMGRQIYILDLTKLKKSQIDEMKIKKQGDAVNEVVALSAIKDVKDAK